jgi:hypothetical protein
VDSRDFSAAGACGQREATRGWFFCASLQHCALTPASLRKHYSQRLSWKAALVKYLGEPSVFSKTYWLALSSVSLSSADACWAADR